MKVSSAIKHFGNKVRIAEALDISKASVSKWKDVVPFESATALEILTDGQLSVDRACYPAIKRAVKSASAASRAA